MNKEISDELNNLLFMMRRTESFYKILLLAISNNDDNNSDLYLTEFAEMIARRLNRICKKLDTLCLKNANMKF